MEVLGLHVVEEIDEEDWSKWMKRRTRWIRTYPLLLSSIREPSLYPCGFEAEKGRSISADEETVGTQNNPVSKNHTIVTDKSNILYIVVSEVNTD